MSAERERYGHLDPGKFAYEYLVALTGAIALTEIYHDITPVTRAREVVQSLLG